MNRANALLAGRVPVVILAAAVLFRTDAPVSAQAVPHLTVVQPGGMPGLPVVSGIELVTNGVRVTWDGPPGYYQLQQRLSLTATQWQQVAGPSLARTATITALYSNAFFRVSGPPPRYAGSQACAGCHQGIHSVERNTRHAGAFTNALFVAAGGQTNSSCLPCHTVGYGLPTGFISVTDAPSTNRLAGVQCENCHGPAGNHAADPEDFTTLPRVEIASTVCGGCHTTSHHPTYDEWRTSGHSGLFGDLNPTNRIDSCGRCHSGSVRLSLLKNEPLPAGDANLPIGCVTCHDPHQNTAHPAQLRNPVGSTNDYYLTTSTNFASAYNPDINLCAQCHNHRGASWAASSSPPHPSPQYNMLLGTVGELSHGLPPNQPGSHARLIPRQCVACHVQRADYVSEEQPAITGHSFRVELYDSCLNCHPLPELLIDLTTMVVSNQVQRLKAGLDLWAAARAPAQLWTNYGTRSWEYTSPGRLSPGGVGPTAAEQALIPVNIQKARFNLYLVLYDGSYGVHNTFFTLDLLDTAENWIQQELSP